MRALNWLAGWAYGQNAATEPASSLRAAFRAAVATAVRKCSRRPLSSGNAPDGSRGRLVEPPIGIEPMTYSLRVNRSGRLS